MGTIDTGGYDAAHGPVVARSGCKTLLGESSTYDVVAYSRDTVWPHCGDATISHNWISGPVLSHGAHRDWRQALKREMSPARLAVLCWVCSVDTIAQLSSINMLRLLPRRPTKTRNRVSHLSQAKKYHNTRANSRVPAGVRLTRKALCYQYGPYPPSPSGPPPSAPWYTKYDCLVIALNLDTEVKSTF